MIEQYYYAFLHVLIELVKLLETTWWKYVDMIHTYPEIAITVLLSSILVLIILRTVRKMKVITYEGDEIHNLVRAMRGEK